MSVTPSVVLPLPYLADLRPPEAPPGFLAGWHSYLLEIIRRMNLLTNPNFIGSPGNAAPNGTSIFYTSGSNNLVTLSQNYYAALVSPSEIPSYLMGWGVAMTAIGNTLNRVTNPSASIFVAAQLGVTPNLITQTFQFSIIPLPIRIPPSCPAFLQSWCNCIVAVIDRLSQITNVNLQPLSGIDNVDFLPRGAQDLQGIAG